MEFPIKIHLPDAEQLARGTAVNLAFRYGAPKGKPLKASDVVGKKGNPQFNKDEYLGVEVSEKLTLSFVDVDVIPPNLIEFEFNECLINLNLPKNIVTTPLQGRNGTIKEFISDDDYQITLEVAIDSYLGNEANEDRFAYPKDKVRELIELLKRPVELVVTSDFLGLFDIYSVVVKEFNLTQETHSNRQSVQVQLLSDNPYEIKVKSQHDVKIS